MLKKLWKMRIVRTILIFCFVLIVLYLFRLPILYGAGKWLVAEDDRVESTIFVLGGNALDRGYKAAQLWKEDNKRTIVCLGGNIPSALELIGKDYTEARLTAMMVRKYGVERPSTKVLQYGTSTYEEAQAILAYCEENGLGEITIVSDKLHLRRVRWVMNRVLADQVNYTLVGATSSKYDEALWWHTEDGMIMVNNEYIKLLYYLFTY